jgi:hypothetical protein
LRKTAKAPAVSGAFAVSIWIGVGVNMRKPVTASVAATSALLPAGSPGKRSVELVCLALALALLALVFRIASIW